MAAQYINAAISIASSIKALSGSGKEPDRIRANETALQAAMQGNQDALDFLRQRTGQYGVAFVNGYGEIGGWATNSAKADAQAKYQQALAAAQIKGGITDFVSQNKDKVQDFVQSTGNTLVPGTMQQIAIVGVILLVVVILIARKGS